MINFSEKNLPITVDLGLKTIALFVIVWHRRSFAPVALVTGALCALVKLVFIRIHQ